MSGDLSRHPLFAKRHAELDGDGAVTATPSFSTGPSLPSSRPALPRAQPNRSSLSPQPFAAAPSLAIPVASPIHSPSPSVSSSSPSPSGHPSQWQSVVSPVPMPSTPHERILAIQTTARSSPSPSSAQFNSGGDSAVVFSGGSAQPVPLRDPAELIQRATAESLKGMSDWGLNMRIVDLINNSPAKTEYLLHALLPRVVHKDHAIGLTALALLESIVKNCPSSHSLVGRREVLDQLVAILPKQIRDPAHRHPFTVDHTRDVLGMERFDRLLVVIQLWGKAFAYNPKAPGFMEVYKEMLNKGVKFAEPDRDELAPVFTPPPNHKLLAERVAGIATAGSGRNSRAGSSAASPSASSAASPASSTPTSQRSSITQPPPAYSADMFSSAPLPSTSSSSYSSSSSSRLADPPLIWTSEPDPRDPDLQSIVSQVKLLLEMLDNSDSASSLAQDDIAIMLVDQLKKAQEGVVKKKLQNPTVGDRIQQLLQINDVLNNTLTYYDGLVAGTMRKRDETDELRRAMNEQDEKDAVRPHVKRASSHDMQSHDIRLVRDNQSQRPGHQYQAEGSAPSFSYAASQSPGHSRSPSAGSNSSSSFTFSVNEVAAAAQRSNGSPTSSNTGLSQFLTSQGLRTPQPIAHPSHHRDGVINSPLSAPPVSTPAASSSSQFRAGGNAATLPSPSSVRGRPVHSSFGSSASSELTDLVSSTGPVPAYGEVVQPYRPEQYRVDQPQPSSATSPLPSQSMPRASSASSQLSASHFSSAPAPSSSSSSFARPSPPSPSPGSSQFSSAPLSSRPSPLPTVPAPVPSYGFAQAAPPPAFPSPFPFPMQGGGLPMSPEQYSAWYNSVMMQQQQQMQYQQYQQPPPPQHQGEAGAFAHHSSPAAAQGGQSGVYGEQGEVQGERGEADGPPLLSSQQPPHSNPSQPPHDQFGQMSLR